jgi:D-sedoheptulose 7-phosphate isomerase
MRKSITNAADIAQFCEIISRNFSRLAQQAGLIARAADTITDSLRSGGKVMFCGNGGSAADSQHLAAELMGRYKQDRAPLPALALTVDTSALTAIANDYGYEDIFARQLMGLGHKGDVLFALSTSGNSNNVLAALKTARDTGIHTIGLTGEDGGKMKSACDICICVPSRETNHIQEMHIAVGHMICGIVEESCC